MDEVVEDWRGASHSGLQRGEIMTLETRHLSNSCQCSGKHESFTQLFKHWEAYLFRMRGTEHWLPLNSDYEPAMRFYPLVEWSLWSLLHGSDTSSFTN